VPQFPLAAERVRYPGEAVAVVVAETLAAARDAAEAVAVEYSVLPAVTDVRKAEGSEPIWPGTPDNIALLSGGAQLFAFYGSNFVTPERAVTLTTKARRYGDRAICLAHAPACHWADADYTQFVAELEAVDKKDIGPLYSYAVAWLAQLDATRLPVGSPTTAPSASGLSTR